MNADLDRREGAQTRLGRTVRATLATAVATSSRHRESHRQTNWLRDVILGGQDGLVNILGIILGVIAGGGSNSVPSPPASPPPSPSRSLWVRSDIPPPSRSATTTWPCARKRMPRSTQC